jgi:hypothetical protein
LWRGAGQRFLSHHPRRRQDEGETERDRSSFHDLFSERELKAFLFQFPPQPSL